MEFYFIKENKMKDLALFQFPTGWNSTFWGLLVYLHYNVSIPNGMEFYKTAEFTPLWF